MDEIWISKNLPNLMNSLIRYGLTSTVGLIKYGLVGLLCWINQINIDPIVGLDID